VTKGKFKHPFLQLPPELRERLRSSLSPEQQRRLMEGTPSPEDLRRLLEEMLSQDELLWVLEGIPPPELSPEPPSSDPSAPREPAPEPLSEPQPPSEPDWTQRKVLGSLLRRKCPPDGRAPADVNVSRLHEWVCDNWVGGCEALEIPPTKRPGKPSPTTLRRVIGKRKD
jgi:hypothetical protein